jgi:spore coat polysaccharide biosynthesis predicted glycosyltransferase SpsG
MNLSYQLKPHVIHFLVEDFGKVKDILCGINAHIEFLRRGTDQVTDISKTRDYIVRNKIDVLIIDKYGISERYVSAMKKHVFTVVISDLRKINYDADLLVNGFIGFNNQKKINRYKTKCLLGPKYQILDNRFASKKRYKKNIDLLATFGGFDERNISVILLQALKDKSIKTKIVLGPATKQTQLHDRLVRKQKTTIITHTKNMVKEMAMARAGLCSGGITTYEFAASNVPFGIICQNKHQLQTAKRWEKIGIAKNLGLVNASTHDRITEFLEDLSRGKIKNQLRNNIQIDGLGAKRIAGEIISTVINSSRRIN